MNEQTNNTRKGSVRVKTPAIVGVDKALLPPQSIETEKAVIGALLLDKNAVTDTIEILTEEMFYDPKHQYIYKAIRHLFGSSDPIDYLTVVNALKKENELELAGGVVYISQLTMNIGSAAHIEWHSRILAQKFTQREIIRLCSESLRDAYDESKDVFDLLNGVESGLFKITQNNGKKSIAEMSDVLKEAIVEIEAARKNSDGLSGVPTGFHVLDQITAGWQRSDMIVIAARPAMGKTAFVLSMARNTAVDFNMGVAIFSLEMSNVQLVKRLISSETRIHAEKLRTGKLENYEMEQLYARVEKLSKAPIYIDDSAGLSVFDFRAKCRRLKQQKDIQVIVIDYLQLMSAGSSKNGNREQEISTISRTIKEIAKELNVPIIALSQLSRSVETRGGDKRPQLSDLRESGAIEQDADIVGFLYRPSYYGFDQNEEGVSNENIGEVIIAKHRNGGLDTVRLKFEGQYAKFGNIDDMDGNNLDFNPSSLNAGMAVNTSFDTQKTTTLGSKMNDPIDFNDADSNDVPF